MTLWKPTEAELYDAGSLKWTGVKTQDGEPTLGAWVAEMDFGTSPAVKERLITAINEGFLGYPPRWVGPGVTQALTEMLERRYGWVVKEEWISVSPSILSALRLTIDELTPAGSAVIVPTPAYMPFLTIPGEFNREAIQVPALHTSGCNDPQAAWSLDLQGIEDGLKAGAGLVILCNPWNPTGRSFSVEELRALHDVVTKYDALVFADEVHAPLVLGDPASFVSYASLGPSFAAHTITAVAASKAWNIAGLNCAQVIIPDGELRAQYEAAPKGRYGEATALGQLAAIPAYLESDQWLAEVLTQVNANLDALSVALEGTGADYCRPEATYLAWVGFEGVAGVDSPTAILRDRYRVGVNDGATLGAGYERWIRVNAAMSPAPWAQVVEAIAEVARG